MLFLIPLAIAFIAFFVFIRSSDEICYLFGTVSLASFLITLIIAPWQVQALVLVLGLVGVGQLIRQFQIQDELFAQHQADSASEPNLREEGLHHLAATDHAIATRIYRGIPYEAPAAEEMPAPQCHVSLKYRGCPVDPP